jgi:hypothetical protein
MELSTTSTSTSALQTPPQSHTLQVDFTWKKFKALITSPSDPSKPLYIVDFKSFSPHLVFTYPSSPNHPFGTGTLHAVSINADCTLHSSPIQLKALKRWQTSYEHLSLSFSPSTSPNKTPVPMTWTSTSGLKTWDFICLDEHQIPVAKFSANIWALKKIGNIEFMGEKAGDERCREEILIVGMTLFYCMVLRSSSLLSFFGAIFARPGHVKDEGKDA